MMPNFFILMPTVSSWQLETTWKDWPTMQCKGTMLFWTKQVHWYLDKTGKKHLAGSALLWSGGQACLTLFPVCSVSAVKRVYNNTNNDNDNSHGQKSVTYKMHLETLTVTRWMVAVDPRTITQGHSYIFDNTVFLLSAWDFYFYFFYSF